LIVVDDLYRVIDRYSEDVKCLRLQGKTTKVVLTGSGQNALLDGALEKAVDQLVAEAVKAHPGVSHVGVTVTGAKGSRIFTSFSRRLENVGYVVIHDLENSAMSEESAFDIDEAPLTITVTTVSVPGAGKGFADPDQSEIRKSSRKLGTVLLKEDAYCLPRAVVVGCAFADHRADPGNKNLFDYFTKISKMLSAAQTDAAISLLRKCGIPLDMPNYSLEEMVKIQEFYAQKYFFVVLGADDARRPIIYFRQGPEAAKKVYLGYNGIDHYVSFLPFLFLFKKFLI
jgi:hypothetical protein